MNRFNVDCLNLKPILQPMTFYKSVQSVHTIRINSMPYLLLTDYTDFSYTLPG